MKHYLKHYIQQMVILIKMEHLNVEEQKVLNIKNLNYLRIMNVMVVFFNGNGKQIMVIYIHVVI